MRNQVFVDRRAPVGRQAFVDCREFVGCQTFVNGQIVASLSLAIGFPAEFLRLHRLYLECESAVDGMLAVENSSQDNLTIEVSDFQLL